MCGMGKASRTKQAPDRRARVAAQREAARRAEQRKRIYIAGGSILAVIIVVIAFVLVKANSGGPAAVGSNGPTGAALTSVINQTTSVPAATLDKVGGGATYPNAIRPITGNQQPLTSGGKPEMLYVGAEYCPYCAAERWAMVVALSRFGTFSGLAAIRSAAKDGAGRAEPYPNTPTWTFLNTHFTSTYLTFTSVELNTNIPDPATGGYTTLQTPTAEQEALLARYDAASNGAIPFIDYGNRYLTVGASYDRPGGTAGANLAPDRRRPAQPGKPGG